jgi:hypothetical protein
MKILKLVFRRESSVRAGRIRAALFAHVVDGKSYTTRQIAARLSISMDAALGRTKRGPFPLTWHALSQQFHPRGKRKEVA